MTLITVDGVALETRTIPGDANAAPLVFLHEGLGSVDLWRTFPRALARQVGARALLYSRQGYGRSDPLAAPRQPTFMHEEALQVLPTLLQATGFAQPILVGHSDGASIALIHAALCEPAPRALVLMAPHVFVEQVCVDAIAAVRARYQNGDLRERLQRYHTHVDDAFLGWADVWLSEPFARWSIQALVTSVPCPIMLIQGTDDEYGSLVQLDAIEEAASVPVSRLVLHDCGHSPHRDHPDLVLDAVSGFIAGLDAAG
ncbi:MAG: alpha/beta hydrolase [Pseudomonadota bacterium]